MKTKHILCASVCMLAALAGFNRAEAQTKPALPDSLNSPLQRTAKPAKPRITAQSLAPQASGKTRRVVAVPAITRATAAPAVPKAARATANIDSANTMPPVQRSPAKAKGKPPVR